MSSGETVSEEQASNERIHGFAQAMAASVVEGCVQSDIPPLEALTGMALAMFNVALSCVNGDIDKAVKLVGESNDRIRAAIADPRFTVEKVGSVTGEMKSDGGILIAANDGIIH